MKLGLIGDVHLHNFRAFDERYVPAILQTVGVNGRCDLTTHVLSKALCALRDAGCEEVIQLGDLFEVPSESAVVLSKAVLAAKSAEMRFRVLVGNHDAMATPASFMESALAPFLGSPCVLPMQNVRINGMDWYNYGEVADGTAFQKPITCSTFYHAGMYSESEPPPVMAGKHDLAVEPLWDRVNRQPVPSMPPIVLAAGHWHHARYFGQRYKARILQAGVLHPTSFLDDGWDRVGYCYTFDDASDVLEAIPVPGLRFINVRDLWQGVLDIRMVYANDCIPIVAVHAESIREAMKIRDALFELFGGVCPDGESGFSSGVYLNEERCVLRVHPADVEISKPAQQSREAYAVRAAARMPLVSENERGRAVQRILAHWKV